MKDKFDSKRTEFKHDIKVGLIVSLFKKVETSNINKLQGLYLYYSTKQREHSFSILNTFFVRTSSEYETLDNDRKVN